MNLDELKIQPDLHEEVRGLVYLSGPMTGYASYNAPAFDEAAAVLRERGYPVISPAEEDRKRGISLDVPAGSTLSQQDTDKVLAEDIGYVSRCDMVVCLPGWEGSGGATFEVAVAVRLGKPVFQYEPGAATLCHMDLQSVIAVCQPKRKTAELHGRVR